MTSKKQKRINKNIMPAAGLNDFEFVNFGNFKNLENDAQNIAKIAGNVAGKIAMIIDTNIPDEIIMGVFSNIYTHGRAWIMLDRYGAAYVPDTNDISAAICETGEFITISDAASNNSGFVILDNKYQQKTTAWYFDFSYGATIFEMATPPLANVGTFVKMLDLAKTSVSRELEGSGNVQGVVTSGLNDASGAMALLDQLTDGEKVDRQEVLGSRFRTARDSGIFALDTAEKFQNVYAQYSKVNDTAYSHAWEMILIALGMPKNIIDNTASPDEIERFFKFKIKKTLDEIVNNVMPYLEYNGFEKWYYKTDAFTFLDSSRLEDAVYKLAGFMTIDEVRRIALGLPSADISDIIGNKNFAIFDRINNERGGGNGQ